MQLFFGLLLFFGSLWLLFRTSPGLGCALAVGAIGLVVLAKHPGWLEPLLWVGGGVFVLLIVVGMSGGSVVQPQQPQPTPEPADRPPPEPLPAPPRIANAVWTRVGFNNWTVGPRVDPPPDLKPPPRGRKRRRPPPPT